jgi:hypothetical protein
MQLSPSSQEFLDRVDNHPGAILPGRGYTSCHGVVTLMENSGFLFTQPKLHHPELVLTDSQR